MKNHDRPESSEDTRRGLLDHREGPATEAGLVSVVIPCYNQAHFLGEAIESVLAQSYPHLEIVVVDDGSTDDTSKVAARYPGVRCIRQDNKGLSGARNTGLRGSRGEYLVFLDSDDRLLPGALEAGLESLKDHPECAFASGHCRVIAADGSPLPFLHQPRIEGDHYLALLSKCYIWPPAMVMYRRWVFEAVGGFDARVNAAADYDLYLRVARRFPVCSHDREVAEYRKHGTSMSGNHALMLGTSVSVLRSQREHVKGNKQYEAAYRAGLRYEQGQWGVPLVGRVRAHVRGREWKQAMRGMLALARYYPRGFVLLDERRKLTRQLRAREEQLRLNNKQLQESKSALRKERQKARRLAEQNQQLTQKAQGLQQQLQSLQDSRTWKLLGMVGNIRAKLPRR